MLINFMLFSLIDLNNLFNILMIPYNILIIRLKMLIITQAFKIKLLSEIHMIIFNKTLLST